MIDPNTKKDGETFEGYNRRRWGGSGWTNHLKSEGRKDGATFNNWKWWPNTLNAHRLIHYVTSIEENKQDVGVDTSKCNLILFEAIYENGENISLIDTLVQIGTEKLGIKDENKLRTYLESNNGTNEVYKEIDIARTKYGVSGVPYFIIGPTNKSKRPYGFSGAQSTKTFIDIFNELCDEEE